MLCGGFDRKGEMFSDGGICGGGRHWQWRWRRRGLKREGNENQQACDWWCGVARCDDMAVVEAMMVGAVTVAVVVGTKAKQMGYSNN